MERKVIKINPNKIEEINLPQNLDEWYKELECDCLTVTYREIGNNTYCIFCDDEGLLKDNIKISLIFNENDMLVGNLIIVKKETDEDGNTLPLSKDDFSNIKENLLKVYNPFTNQESWLVKPINKINC